MRGLFQTRSRQSVSCNVWQYSAVLALAIIVLFGSNGHLRGADEDNVTIGAGDLIEITVNAEANIAQNLSGKFRVRSDGTIRYPILGSLKVGELRASDVAQRIAKELGEQAPFLNFPTVVIAEFAPVFLIGDVIRSGPVEFRPNAKLLELVLLAGGIRTMPEGESSPAGERNDLNVQMSALTIRRDRLLAEARGERFVPKTRSEFQEKETSGVAAHELEIFNSHRRAQDVRAAAYHTQRKILDSRIATLEQSVRLHDEHIKLAEQRVGRQQALADRGIVPRSTIPDLEIQFIMTRRGALEVQSALFEAQQKRAALEQEIAEIELKAGSERLHALRDVEVELGRIRAKLDSSPAPDSVAAPEQEAPPNNLLGRAVSFTLIRRVEGNYRVVAADEDVSLQRGDIVRVDAGR